MKENELRIGNFVTVNNPEFRPDLKDIAFEVKAIHESFSRSSYEYGVGLKHINMIPNKYYEYPSQLIGYINPINLTEEWLTKFGFEEDAESKSWSILTTLDKYDYQFEVSNKYQEYFQPDFARMDIKYVHELQNLYFALTGVELQLSST